MDHAFKVVNPSLDADVVFIHLGTNDLREMSPTDFVMNLGNLVQYITSNISSEVYVSEILPRADEFRESTIDVNRLLAKHVAENNRVTHREIHHQHLFDKVHLRKSVLKGERYSGVQLLARDFDRALIGTDPQDSRITMSLNGDLPRRFKSRDDSKKSHYHSIGDSRSHVWNTLSNSDSWYGPLEGTMV